MNTNVPITMLQFIFGVVIAIIPQIFLLIKAFRDNKLQKEIENLKAQLQKPLTDAQAQSAMGDALEKLGAAYDRAQETIKSQDSELAGLRPLVFDVAVAKQEATQCELNKEDWKAHAGRLETQLIEHRIVPVPFVRLSAEDSEKMKAITREQVAKYIPEKNK